MHIPFVVWAIAVLILNVWNLVRFIKLDQEYGGQSNMVLICAAMVVGCVAWLLLLLFGIL